MMTARFHNLIGGEWIAGVPSPNVNPSDIADIVGEYDHADVAQAQAAVAAARAAFPAWSRSPIQQRADLLEKVGAELFARRQELGDLLAREEGKTLPEAVGEVTRAAMIFKFFAGEALRPIGEIGPSVRPGISVEVTREPVGVVGLITPWNFPIAIPAWKAAPALAYGNCVVLKPAELTPGCAWALADIVHRAGFPPGVFNLVNGKGQALGPAFTAAGSVDAISFTGSVPVGAQILKQAAASQIKVQLEMGGKNPLVVLEDADLDLALRCALDGGFFSTGQRCTASSRIVVQDAIHDRFVAELAGLLERQVIDDARKPGVNIGPVVDAKQLQTDLDYIALARQEGAHLVAGGERLARDTQGFFLQPALFSETTPDMRINREEVFGPVASIIRVRDYDEALAVANDTSFGLCAGICTGSLKLAAHFKRNVQAGMVMVNLPTAGVDYHTAFGGAKASSYGPKEQGRYAAEFFTSPKVAYVNAG
jgi:aldehyde dehydrogenase (NAD+)